jgi:hypothetical protein
MTGKEDEMQTTRTRGTDVKLKKTVEKGSTCPTLK